MLPQYLWHCKGMGGECDGEGVHSTARLGEMVNFHFSGVLAFISLGSRLAQSIRHCFR